MISAMRIKGIVFASLAVVIPTAVVAFTAEFAVRWYVTGGAVTAAQSLLPEIGASAGWLEADPDLGYKLNPTTELANSLGIPNAELTRKTNAHARLMVLGDSVAFDREGFVTQLTRRLAPPDARGVEVVNASIPGYTTHQERVLFERDLAPYSPDVVLLQYCMNDNHQFLHRLDEGGQWIIVPEALAGPDADSWLPAWLEASYIVKRIRWRQRASERSEQAEHDIFPWRGTPEFGNAWQPETWGAQEAELRALLDAAERVGARLAIVVIPYEPQLVTAALERDREYVLRPQRTLAEIADRLGIPLLDLHPVFVDAGPEPLFRDGVHLTDRGHNLATDAIEAFLASEALLAGGSNAGSDAPRHEDHPGR